VTTTVVDVSTLDDLPAQETDHVMFRVATVCHLPRLQMTVDEPPAVVGLRSLHRTALRRRSSTVDGGWLREGGEEDEKDDGAEHHRQDGDVAA